MKTGIVDLVADIANKVDHLRISLSVSGKCHIFQLLSAFVQDWCIRLSQLTQGRCAFEYQLLRACALFHKIQPLARFLRPW